MIIAPSLLSADFLNLEKDIKAFEKEENLWFHIDVMDGHYVPNLSFGKAVFKNIHKITHHKLDAHLMVSNPERYILDYKDLGLHNLTFHWEATQHHDGMIAEIKKHYPSVGVSLNPGSDLSVIPEYLLKQIDVLLLMSVNPGFGGQSFIGGVLDKVRAAHELKQKLRASFEIQVDGGVTSDNAESLKQAGATVLVAGSFIFNQNQSKYSEQISKLRG